MGRKKSKKSRTNNKKKARDVVSRLIKYERRREEPSEEVTSSKAEYQYKTDDFSMSDDTSQLGDATATWAYFEKYNDEKIKGAISELEQRATEKIHYLETDLNNKIHELKTVIERRLSEFKTSLLMWAFGIIVTITLGLIGFHFTTLNRINKSINKKIQNSLKPINKQIIYLNNRVMQLQKLEKREK